MSLLEKSTAWLQRNWLGVVIAMVTCMMFFVGLIAFSWLYGYWSNAINGTKFAIDSCWQGITVVITGLGGIAALAKAAWTRYEIDSKYNSNEGEHPYKS